MSEGAKTFNLAGCMIDFAVPLSGFGEGSVIEVEPNADTFTVTEGVDGSAVSSYTGCETFKVKIKLLQTSSSNAVIAAAHEADRQSLKAGGGGILLPLAFKDNNGIDAFFSPKARVIKAPKLVRGSKVETVEWELHAFEGKLFLGGNP